MKAAPTTIGKPSVHEHRNQICLPLNQVSDAIYTLAALCEETDWDGVDALVEQIQITMLEGSSTMPALSSALLSKGLTGSFTAARDDLNRAFAASGRRNFVFEHNAYPGPQSHVLRNAHISVRPLSADHQQVALEIRVHDRRITGDMKVTPEKSVAEALGLNCALGSVTVRVPLEIVDAGTAFRFDMQPFADALRAQSVTPGEHMSFTEVTGQVFADWFEDWYNHQTDGRTPTVRLSLTDDYTLAFGTHGCMFSTYDRWEQTRTVHCTRAGTVFSGPISTMYNSDKLDAPEAYVSLRGDALHLPDREKFMLDLAATLVTSITSYHH